MVALFKSRIKIDQSDASHIASQPSPKADPSRRPVHAALNGRGEVPLRSDGTKRSTKGQGLDAANAMEHIEPRQLML